MKVTLEMLEKLKNRLDIAKAEVVRLSNIASKMAVMHNQSISEVQELEGRMNTMWSRYINNLEIPEGTEDQYK